MKELLLDEMTEKTLATQRRYTRRLIEVDLPIKRISANSIREKSIRHGHISTLHVWWARRPLPACRAIVLASLWPDPADPLCPEEFKEEARKLMLSWAKNNKRFFTSESYKVFIKYEKDPTLLQSDLEVRKALLEFIADFSDFKNSNVKEFLETSNSLTETAYKASSKNGLSKPTVSDPFAGGGAIPVEALRCGANVFASDLNPVAVLLNKVSEEYIPQYGAKLAEEIRRIGNQVKRNSTNELKEYFGKQTSVPVAYIWARTIKCEGPSCGAEVPLVRSFVLAKRNKQTIALNPVIDSTKKRIDFEIIQNPKKIPPGTVKRGSATCPLCSYTTPVARVREQLKQQEGGADSSRLLCKVFRDEKEKSYQLPTNEDIQLNKKVIANTCREGIIPPTELPLMSGVFNVPIYGITRWDLLFSSRQLAVADILGKHILSALEDPTIEDSHKLPLKVLLLLGRDKYLDFRTTLCGWISKGEKIGHTFGRQSLGMIFDWVEGTPFGNMSGSWDRCIEYIAEYIEFESKAGYSKGTVERADAQCHILPDDSVDAFITDPPYYNAVPYADLSDFFYIWLKKDLKNDLPQLFTEELAPKDNELCEMSGWDSRRYAHKDARFYEKGMAKALEEGRRICTPEGIGVVVFAHKTTAGWESLLSAIIDSGWVVTGSWPISTERGGRLRAMNSAALGSSIHLVCRPREDESGNLTTDSIGNWRDVLDRLPIRIKEWMVRLSQEGVAGADAIFACLGPALEIFSQYSRVEKASGDQVTLNEYLAEVWSTVAKEALNMIFEGADTSGFEEDGRLTAMWLWTLSTGTVSDEEDIEEDADESPEEEDSSDSKKITGFVLEYDAARKISQALGVHLNALNRLVAIKKDKAVLLPVSERARFLFGKESNDVSLPQKKKAKQLNLFEVVDSAESEWDNIELDKGILELANTTLDKIHQSMILFATGRSEALKRYLTEDGVGKDQRFWKLAQALSALYPAGTDEKRWVDGVLARKKGLGL